jgi:hypothetical protein
MTTEQQTTDEDVASGPNEVTPDETYMLPAEVAAELTPPGVSVSFNIVGVQAVAIGTNNSGSTLRLRSKWGRLFCNDGPCLSISPGGTYTSKRAFFCRFDGFEAC